MSHWKPYPEISLEASDDSSAMRLVTSKGEVIVTDLTCDTASLERLLVCWNALRNIAFPAAHIPATDDYVKRLDALRRDAVDQLEASKAKQKVAS